jgi:hypothetical protein
MESLPNEDPLKVIKFATGYGKLQPKGMKWQKQMEIEFRGRTMIQITQRD